MESLISKSEQNKQIQEVLVKEHAILVKRIARHLLGRLPQSVLLEDLIQAGMIGLLEALKNYDATKGAAFETYASIRIRGHMLDEVRRNDWVPRSVYRNARMISTAVKSVENRCNRDAKDQEVAAELGIDLTEYHAMLNDSNGAHLYGFDDLGVTDDMLKGDTLGIAYEPDTNAIQADLQATLAHIIDGLPKKEQLVLSLYYEHDLNLKDIGDILGVSESRISQLHSQATHRIKSRLQKQI